MTSEKELEDEINRKKECYCDSDNTCNNCLEDCLLTAELKGRQDKEKELIEEIDNVIYLYEKSSNEDAVLCLECLKKKLQEKKQ
jgi:hypothetical protein